MTRTFEARKQNGDGFVQNVANVVAPIDYELLAPDVGANTISQTDNQFSGTSECKLWIYAKAENYVAGSDTITVSFYRQNAYVGQVVLNMVNASAGESVAVDIDFEQMSFCDRAISTGTITVQTSGEVEVFISKLGGSGSTINGDSSYDSVTGTDKVTERDPVTLHNVDDHLIDEVNQAIATYRNIFSMENYKNASIQCNISGGVILKIYGTDDKTADNSSTSGWIDMSLDIMKQATLEDDEAMFLLDTNIRVLKFMVEYVTSDATNAVDVFVYKGN